MKRAPLTICVVIGFIGLCLPAMASEECAEPHAGAAGALVSGNAQWAGVMVTIIAGMFLAAAAVGIAVRANTPEPQQVHDDHGHAGHSPSDSHHSGH